MAGSKGGPPHDAAARRPDPPSPPRSYAPLDTNIRATPPPFLHAPVPPLGMSTGDTATCASRRAPLPSVHCRTPLLSPAR